MARTYLLTFNLIFSLNLYSLDGYISIDQSVTERDWNFTPSINNSFESSETKTGEIYINYADFGFKATATDFFLRLDRPTYPKILDLTAKSNAFEFIYLFDDQNKRISISSNKQEADDQFINCYTFSSLIIGFCDDAKLSIINDKEKYKPLNNSSIIMISGKNDSFKINFNSFLGLSNLYEYNFFIEYVENDFDWLTPVEEIILNKGFIYNLGYQGQKIGNLIENSLSILPQRDTWNTYVIGLSSTTYYNIFKNIYLFIEPTVIYVEQSNYSQISNINNHNIRLKSGLLFGIKDIQLSIYANLYKNNLYGFEHITFNQRSEHHFDSNYGFLGIKLKYTF